MSFDKQDKRISRYLTQSKIIHFVVLTLTHKNQVSYPPLNGARSL
ncbi:hypothetical protein HPHPH44_1214 [Helicobacter pylori Hp H-44]|nr:hypothetical protein HPHPH44_1214 [Helicobacter pylori Hp H-44]